MIKNFLLELIGAQVPSNAAFEDGQLVVSLDMKQAFHHGYIDIHGRKPQRGTNPLFDEYIPLLVQGDQQFLLEAQNWAIGDHRPSEHHRLGRVIGRAYLSQSHGYRWFMDIKSIQNHPYRGWKAVIPRTRKPHTKDNSGPDVLATKPGRAAVVEYKGTGRYWDIESRSKRKKWGRQVKRVKIYKNSERRTLKSWVIASYLATAKSGNCSKIYAKDPPGDPLGPEELQELAYWTSLVHTNRNLRRIDLGNIADAISASASDSPTTRDPLQDLEIWRCDITSLQDLDFIGGLRDLGWVARAPSSSRSRTTCSSSVSPACSSTGSRPGCDRRCPRTPRESDHRTQGRSLR